MSILAPPPAIVAIPASAPRWCILRTGGQRTLRLVASLQDAGMEAWTPTEHIRRRVPRGKQVEHFTTPLLPSYAFVREQHLEDLRSIERTEVSAHPAFSIFRYYGSSVFVEHRTLHSLRQAQQDSYVRSLPSTGRDHRSKARAPMFDIGDRMKLHDGPFSGFECVVEDSDGLTTTLALRLFGRDAGLKIPTSHLRSDGVATLLSAA